MPMQMESSYFLTIKIILLLITFYKVSDYVVDRLIYHRIAK